jgi:hypothetical protein
VKKKSNFPPWVPQILRPVVQHHNNWRRSLRYRAPEKCVGGGWHLFRRLNRIQPRWTNLSPAPSPRSAVSPTGWRRRLADAVEGIQDGKADRGRSDAAPVGPAFGLRIKKAPSAGHLLRAGSAVVGSTVVMTGPRVVSEDCGRLEKVVRMTQPRT